MMKLIGSVNGWFEERRYGWVNAANSDGVITRYFLHGANVVCGVPEKSKIVRFDSVRNAKGFLCMNAEVFESKQEMERADAATALADSTTCTPEVKRG